MALAGKPDALTVVDPLRDVDLERTLLEHAAAAAALLARGLHDPPRARAAGTGLGTDELPEDASRDLLQAAGAVAGRTGDRLGPRLGSAAVAGRAGHLDGVGHRALDPARRLAEVDLDLGEDVAAAPAAASPRSEQVFAEEGREEIGDVPEVEGRRPASAAQAFVAEPVVDVAALRVRKHLVRLDHLLEAVLGVGRLGDVRMQPSRELPEGLLDLLRTPTASPRALRSSHVGSSPSTQA